MEHILALIDLIGRERVSVAEADRVQHSRDQSDHTPRLPDVVIWPESTAEVSRVLAHANDHHIPVTAWGAGTSLEGNSIPLHGGILLNFQRMNRIVALHAADFQVTVEPGIFYKDLNQILARDGLFFAPDPGANASIGGMLANNAAGIRTVRYGASRDNVLALEVVLADGTVLPTGSRAVKQSSGYDLTHLFVGSEGTLGIITQATLKLAPIPAAYSAATAAFPTVAGAAQVVFEIIGGGLEPSALELMDTTAVSLLNSDEAISLPPLPHLLMEFSGASESVVGEKVELAELICREAGCQHFQAGIGRDARARLWEARHRLFEVHLRHFPGHAYLLTDVAVPISQYPILVRAGADRMAALGLEGSLFGHAGDGNLHTDLFFPAENADARRRAQQFNDYLVETAIDLGGTATGEHGVGIGKQKYMLREHGEAALGLMGAIKATLDPNGILNPGKILGQELSETT